MPCVLHIAGQSSLPEQCVQSFLLAILVHVLSLPQFLLNGSSDRESGPHRKLASRELTRFEQHGGLWGSEGGVCLDSAPAWRERCLGSLLAEPYTRLAGSDTLPLCLVNRKGEDISKPVLTERWQAVGSSISTPSASGAPALPWGDTSDPNLPLGIKIKGCFLVKQ